MTNYDMDQIERERSQKQKDQWHSYIDDNLVKSSKPCQQWDAQTQSYVNVIEDHIEAEHEKMTKDPVGYELYNAPENTLPLGNKDKVNDQENIKNLQRPLEKEEVTNPKHYNERKMEPLDYIIANELDFLEGNIIKYITRYTYKGGVNDLLKARTYLEKIIERERDGR
jgi:hypothetical protein